MAKEIDVPGSRYGWRGASVLPAEYFSSPSPAVGGLKVWTGSAWEMKPVKVWTGSAWLTKPVKRWNGASWV